MQCIRIWRSWSCGKIISLVFSFLRLHGRGGRASIPLPPLPTGVPSQIISYEISILLLSIPAVGTYSGFFQPQSFYHVIQS